MWRGDFGSNKVLPQACWRTFAVGRDGTGGVVVYGGAGDLCGDPDGTGTHVLGSLWDWSNGNPVNPTVIKLGKYGLGGVYAVAFTPEAHYVGGSFYGGMTAHARGGATLSFAGKPVGGGVYSPGVVGALLPCDGTVLVGGNYVSFDGAAETLAHVDPVRGRWKPLQVPIDAGPKTWVNALEPVGGAVAAGGQFAGAGGAVLNSIGLLNLASGAWTACGGASVGVTSGGRPGNISAIRCVRDRLYVGGDFDRAGGVAARSIACYDMKTRAWSGLDGGVTGEVRALLPVGDRLVVGGRFTSVGSAQIDSPAVACWDMKRDAWAGMDGGLKQVSATHPPSLYACVTCLAERGGGQFVLVGGEFDTVGTQGLAFRNCALWDWA